MRSKQPIFCNACGRKEHRFLPGMGSTYKVCSVPCVREMQWREALSLLNKEYYPHPDPNYYNPDYNPDTGKKY